MSFFFHKRENIFLANSENNTKGNLSDGCVKYTVAPAGGENNYYFNIDKGYEGVFQKAHFWILMLWLFL